MIKKPLLIISAILIILGGLYFIDSRNGISVPFPDPITFQNIKYVPAHCIMPISIFDIFTVKKIGKTDEGFIVYSKDGGYPLLKRNDGYYQCYTKQPQEPQ